MSFKPIESHEHLLGLMSPEQGFGLSELPSYNSSANVIPVVASLAVFSVGFGASFFGKVGEAGAQDTGATPVSVCDQDTNEQSVNQYPGTLSEFDMSMDTIAFNKVPCAGHEFTATTYVRNRSTSIIAQPIRIKIEGTMKVMDSIKRVDLDDVQIPIKTRGVDQINMNDRVFEKYGGGPFDSVFDRNNMSTRRLYYGNTYWDSVLNDGAKKVTIYFQPSTAEPKMPFPAGAYISVNAASSQQTDLRPTGNTVVRDFEILDALGNPVVPETPPTPVSPCKKVGSSLTVSRPVKGIGRIKFQVKSSGPKIDGTGNGASRFKYTRSRAARGVIWTKVRTAKLPSGMRRIGNYIYVDIPAAGIRSGSTMTRYIKYFSSGGTPNPKSRFIAPNGRVKGCSVPINRLSERNN